MRATITLTDDVAAAVERVRRERSIGLSEAVNDLIRAGLAVHPPFEQVSRRLGLLIDVTDVAGALELLEGGSR